MKEFNWGQWLMATVVSILALTLVVTAAIPMIMDAASQNDRLALENASAYWLSQGWMAYADPSGNFAPTAGDNVSDLGTQAASWNDTSIDGFLYSKGGASFTTANATTLNAPTGRTATYVMHRHM
jgi:hypothetical protein